LNFSTVIEFWFKELTPDDWFSGTSGTDELIRERFSGVHRAATRGELMNWRESATGRLAEVIVLDQFSRNIYRGTPQAFVHDGMALVLAQEAIRNDADKELSIQERPFLFLPFMHSESKVIHEMAVPLFSQAGLEFGLKYELMHKDIIDRFGRYPHRNQILGRESTPEEIEFLTQPGSGF
jgi:uncharacterized protein (DUF924 family)